MKKTALIAGGSGLVGNELLKLLLVKDVYEKVFCLVRKELPISHDKLEQIIVDFETLDRLPAGVDHVFCSLGTTIKNAGSQEAFRRVDYDYPFKLAELSSQNDVKVFCLVTAMGANEYSSFFYNRVKGDIEKAIAKIPINHIGIFRPSMLLGERKESRPGESIGKIFMKVLDFVMPQNYKGIEAKTVAKSMIKYAENPNLGLSIILSGEMN